MVRMKSLSLCLMAVAVSIVLVAPNLLTAGDASRYPQDDQLANEPAPWTIKGQWGERGNWGRWGEETSVGWLILSPLR